MGNCKPTKYPGTPGQPLPDEQGKDSPEHHEDEGAPQGHEGDGREGDAQHGPEQNKKIRIKDVWPSVSWP